jgi:hypothetical protein
MYSTVLNAKKTDADLEENFLFLFVEKLKYERHTGY